MGNHASDDQVRQDPAVPVLFIKALNPFVATFELVSNFTNIWFPGTDTTICL